MWVKTIKDYKDKETKELCLSSQNIVKEVSDERGKVLVEKGFVIEMIVKPKEETTTESPAEESAVEPKKEQSDEVVSDDDSLDGDTEDVVSE